MSGVPLRPGYAKGFPGLSVYLNGVSENTLRSWVKQGMPTIRVGDVNLFKLDAVDAWLSQFCSGTFNEGGSDVSLDAILKELK